MYWRVFGSDPEVVSAKLAAVIAGSHRQGMLSPAMHFPGHGRTALDSLHLELPTIDRSRKEWLASDALPFRAVVEPGQAAAQKFQNQAARCTGPLTPC